MHDNGGNTALLILCICIVCIFAIRIFYYLRKIQRIKDHDVMKKRYVGIAIKETQFFLIMSIFYCILFAAILNNWKYINIIKFLIGSCMRILFCLLILRFWLLYYDLLFLKAILNRQWIKIIDPDHIDIVNINSSSWFNWIVKNKSKYGNINRTTITIFFISLFISILFCWLHTELYTFPESHGSISTFNLYLTFMMIDLCIVIIYNLILMLLWHRIYLLRLQDNYFINAELHRIVVFLCFRLIITIIINIIEILEAKSNNKDLVETDYHNINYLELITTIIIYIMDVLIVRYSIIYVYNKVHNMIFDEEYVIRKLTGNTSYYLNSNRGYKRKYWNSNDDEEVINNFYDDATMSLTANDITEQLQLKVQLTRRFNQIVADQNKMEEYIQFLSMDFKICNWCGFIELFQFSKLMLKYIKRHEIEVKIPFIQQWYDNINFPEDNNKIPLSRIIVKHKASFMDRNNVKNCIEINDEIIFIEQICKPILNDIFEKYFKWTGFKPELEIKDVASTFKHEINDNLEPNDWYQNEDIDLERILGISYEGCQQLFATLLKSLYRYQKKCFTP